MAKSNVKVNKTKEVKEELGGQGHQECQVERRLVKEPLRSRMKKAKGQGSHELLVFIIYPSLKVINAYSKQTAKYTVIDRYYPRQNKAPVVLKTYYLCLCID